MKREVRQSGKLKEQRTYIVVPRQGVNAKAAAAGREMLRSMHMRTSKTALTEVTVLDSVREDGAKLVTTPPEQVSTLSNTPGLQVVPLRYFQLARSRRPQVADTSTPGRLWSLKSVDTMVRCKTTNAPIGGASIIAFTDYQARQGAQATTDEHGRATLRLAPGTPLQRLLVYPPLAGYWGWFEAGVRLPEKGELELSLPPIDVAHVDSLRHHLGAGAPSDGAGVRVAVIDTGVGPHPDLPNASGDIDNGDGHGTHVAGIIGAQQGRPGVAPGVEIWSYRVFSGNGYASNWEIGKAIDRAAQDSCDLINLSLKIEDAELAKGPGALYYDEYIRNTLEDARHLGALPFASAGNDSETDVSFPASEPMCMGVTALGTRGTFPPNTLDHIEVAAPFGANPDNFVAAFSNIGPAVDMVGPGVGVISTVPGGYGVMSGTSMACPAMVGMAARLLGKNVKLLGATRDAQRAAQIENLVRSALEDMGFPAEYQGGGMLR